MSQIFILACLLAVAAAVPVDKTRAIKDLFLLSQNGSRGVVRNSALEQTILNLLEELRETMVTGSDDVPVLDPLNVHHLNVNGEDFGIPGVTLSANNLVVNDLSTFVVDSLEVTAWLIVNTIKFDATIPSLEVSASNYDLEASALGYNVFGNGEAKLRFLNPRIHGSLQASISIFGSQTISITSADLHVELAEFEPEITGLFGDDNASEFANNFLKHFLPEVLFLYQREISDFLNEIVPEVANAILADIL